MASRNGLGGDMMTDRQTDRQTDIQQGLYLRTVLQTDVLRLSDKVSVHVIFFHCCVHIQTSVRIFLAIPCS